VDFLQARRRQERAGNAQMYTRQRMTYSFKPQCHHGYADQSLVCKIEFDDNPPILDLALAHTIERRREVGCSCHIPAVKFIVVV
jgi:hypothetical protein